MARLVVENLSKTLRDRERVFRLLVPFFELKAGDRKAVVGATGSGKTTAMDMLALASRPDRCERFTIEDGSRRIEVPCEASRSAERRLARLRARHFGYVVQTSPLFPFLSLRDNVRLQQRIAKRRDDAHADRLIAALGLSREANARPEGLSVGQRQRAGVARALAHRPSFLLCDEPTGALDPETAALCLAVMDEAARDCGAGILMITHDPALAAAMGFDPTSIERVETSSGEAAAVLSSQRQPCPGVAA